MTSSELDGLVDIILVRNMDAASRRRDRKHAARSVTTVLKKMYGGHGKAVEGPRGRPETQNITQKG